MEVQAKSCLICFKRDGSFADPIQKNTAVEILKVIFGTTDVSS